MRFGVLGHLAVTDDQGRSIEVSARMRRLVLGVLLVSANRVVASDRIAEGLWGDDLPQDPDAVVRVHVSRLRNDLGSGDSVIVTRSPGYMVRIGPDDLDAQVFERLIGEGDRALADGALGVAAAKYRDALDLWRGDAYETFFYESWAQGEIRRLTELRSYTAEQQMEALLQSGLHDQLIPDLEAMVAAAPLRERLWGQLMTALYRSGRQSDALRAFARARDTLVEELGIDPSIELRTLEQRILEQDPDLEAPAAPQPEAEVRDVALLATQFTPHQWGDDEIRARFSVNVGQWRGQVFELRDRQLIGIFTEAFDALSAAEAIVQELTDEGSRSPPMALDVATVDFARGAPRGLGVHRAVRIAGLAQPGRVLVTPSAASALDVSELGSLRLNEVGERDVPGVTRPMRLLELDSGTAATQQVSGRTEPRSNLPAQLTSFVGRAAELATVAELVAQHRLVTVTGPGGAGKTRLALQVASDLVGMYRDGVWLVELAPVSDPEQLAATFGQSTGLAAQPTADQRGAFLDAIADKESLLLVDNCEHVIDAIADLVHAVLSAAPAVRVLCTSREPLGVPGEHLWLASALPVPDPDLLPRLDTLDRNDAVGLFLARAKTVRAGFALSDANAQMIVRLCRHVDGLPLAIELVAAQLRHRTLEEIEAGIGSMLDVPSPYRTVPSRHQTLEAATEWSYRSLDAAEQEMFARLSVFPDSFGLDAAIAVGCDSAAERAGGARILHTLVDKSLVAVAHEGDHRRYQLLATLRSFARRRLTEADDAGAQVTSRHANYFATWSMQAFEGTVGSEQALWLARMDAEQASAVAALHWSLENGDIDRAAQLAASYGWFWLLRGPLSLGRRLVEQTIAAGGAGTPSGRQLLMCAGYLCGELGDLAAARRYLENKLTADQDVGDVGAIAGTLTNLGVVADRGFDHRAARGFYQQSIELLEAEPSTEITWERLASSHQNLAATLRELGAADDARVHAEQAVELALKRGHRYLECHATLLLARIDIDSGELESAAHRLDSAESIAADLGDATASYVAAIERSRLRVVFGAYEEAVSLVETAWEIVIESGDRSNLPLVADQACLVALARGDLDGAATYAEVARGEAELGVDRVPGVQLQAVVAAAAGRAKDAAALLGRARALQRERGCVTAADLRSPVASAEAACRAALGAEYERIVAEHLE